MKRLFIAITALFVFSATAEAQQRFRRTSFPINSFVVNPAVAGTSRNLDFINKPKLVDVHDGRHPRKPNSIITIPLIRNIAKTC